MPNSLPRGESDKISVFLDVRVKRDDYEERLDFFFSRVFSIASEFGTAAMCQADDTGEPMVLLVAGKETSRDQLRACLDQILSAIPRSFEDVGVETDSSFDLLS